MQNGLQFQSVYIFSSLVMWGKSVIWFTDFILAKLYVLPDCIVLMSSIRINHFIATLWPCTAHLLLLERWGLQKSAFVVDIGLCFIINSIAIWSPSTCLQFFNLILLLISWLFTAAGCVFPMTIMHILLRLVSWVKIIVKSDEILVVICKSTTT